MTRDDELDEREAIQAEGEASRKAPRLCEDAPRSDPDGPPFGDGSNHVNRARPMRDGASDDTDAEPPPPRQVPEITLLDGPAIARPLPEPEYLVREIGLVAGGGAPHLVAGYGFSGKTLALQSLALSLAAGRAVWGVYPCGAGRVVHVDLEQGERLTLRRYQRLALADGIDLAALKDALVVAVYPDLRLALDHADRWRQIMIGRHLIIVDSLRAATGGQDENSSDIRAGLDMLGNLANETGCRAVVIHHARKPPNEPGAAAGGRYAIRGSSAIFDACDAAYTFSAEKGEAVKVENFKARSHGELVEDFALVVSDVEVSGDPRAGLGVRVYGAELVTQQREAKAKVIRAAAVSRDAEKVRDVVTRTPGIGKSDLAAAAGLCGARVSAAVTHLGEAIEVRDERSGNSHRKAHYLRGAP